MLLRESQAGGNKNYRKGRRKEYALLKKAKEAGFIAFRSAGSHSPIDVCFIDVKGRNIGFIQSKPDSMSENAKNRLKEALKDLSGAYMVRFDVL